MSGERRYNQALLAAAQREQFLLAQQLHDTVCQSLAGISLLIKVLERRVKQGGAIEVQELVQIARYLDEAIEHVRAPLSLPGKLSRKGGLAESLKILALETGKSVPCRFAREGTVAVNPPLVAFVFYRIAREVVDALRATGEVREIVLELSKEPAAFSLSIEAVGPAALGSKKTLPFFDILTRYADAVGATLQRTRLLGHGISIVCRMPGKKTTKPPVKRSRGKTSAP